RSAGENGRAGGGGGSPFGAALVGPRFSASLARLEPRRVRAAMQWALAAQTSAPRGCASRPAAPSLLPSRGIELRPHVVRRAGLLSKFRHVLLAPRDLRRE